jgi:hypothetical protein
MEEKAKHGKVGLAAMKAGMHRETARKYIACGKMPTEEKKDRTWRTRKDPFEEDWPEIEAKLKDAPELEAKTLFEDLLERRPEKYQIGQLRTLQRRIIEWKAKYGPDREVFFAQEHRPGEAMQTDFTWCNELSITICGEAFEHMLCHTVLPFSNWEWATVCQSESMESIKRGVQVGIFRLGRVPEWHQTDNSTSATHGLATGKRGFNGDYEKLMKHLGMKPRTIAIGASNQNGDVEALNGALKRRLKQHLLMRHSHDFESVEAYERWVQQVMEKANDMRREKIAQELAVMRPLAVERFPEYTEETVTVTSWSTIRIKNNAYSVPSRLISQNVRVKVFANKIEVWYGGQLQLSTERLTGSGGRRIDYRHIIWSLVQKPWAFARYRYREELFPSLIFRKAYDALLKQGSSHNADREYLRILHLAATTMESEVEIALELMLTEQRQINADQIKGLVTPTAKAEMPEIEVLEVNLSSYDELLAEEVMS